MSNDPHVEEPEDKDLQDHAFGSAAARDQDRADEEQSGGAEEDGGAPRAGGKAEPAG